MAVRCAWVRGLAALNFTRKEGSEEYLEAGEPVCSPVSASSSEGTHLLTHPVPEGMTQKDSVSFHQQCSFLMQQDSLCA